MPEQKDNDENDAPNPDKDQNNSPKKKKSQNMMGLELPSGSESESQ